MWNGLLPSLVPVLRRLGVSFSTAEASGRALARIVTEPYLGGVSGRYFEIDDESRTSQESYDRSKAEELWETSAVLVGLGPRETPLRVAAAATGST